MGRRSENDSRAFARQTALAGLFFAGAAVLFTWPLAFRFRSGMPDLFDDKLNAWIFHWDFHQVFRNPLRLFDTNIFYPARDTLAFSENLFGAAVFGFPLYLAGASTLATANVLMLLGMALSGVAGWALAREVTGDPEASLVGGIVFAFVPWRIAQLPHVQFQWGAFLALLLLFLLRALDRGTRRDAALFGLFFGWNALSNVHYALFSGLLVALVLGHDFLTREKAIFFPRFRRVLLAGAVATLLVVPFYVPYLRASRSYGMVRGEGEIAAYSGRPVDFLTAGPQNKLYAPITQKWAHAEGDFFPGLTAVLLAAVAIRRLRKAAVAAESGEAPTAGRLRLARLLDFFLAAGILAWAAAALLHRQALGPVRLRDPGRILAICGVLAVVRLLLAFPRRSRYSNLADFARRNRIGPRALLFVGIAGLGVLIALGTHTPFYRILVQSAGAIFRSIRVPSRGIVLFDLALGVLAAWGLALLTRGWRPGARHASIAAALLLLTIEYRAFPIEIGSVPEEAAPVYRWLSGIPIRGAAVEWPMAVEVEPEHVFRSTEHWKPIVNGYSGFAPPRYDALAAVLRQPRIPDTVWISLRSFGASMLLFHPSETTDENRRSYLDLLRRGIAEGHLRPVGAFPRPGQDAPDLVFRLARSAPFPIPVPPERAIRSDEAAMALLARIEERLSAPFGTIERPSNGEEIRSGYWLFGWALDDSGLAGVRLAARGAPPVDCLIGQPFPGVAAVYPKYPDRERPGFGCPVPSLPPGARTLSIVITGRDGGQAVLERSVRIR
ncbi:MAG: hypothetical protein ABI682_09195 [Acidobacteriota bacterium]